MKIAILNGPNLNMLGVREPEIYGTTTLAEIEKACKSFIEPRHGLIIFRQSNSEGQLIDWIQELRGDTDALILNPAGFTSTSIALLDALKTFPGPIVEVHLANIHRREPFRHFSYVSLAATAVICGFGSYGYIMAIQFLLNLKGKCPSERD